MRIGTAGCGTGRRTPFSTGSIAGTYCRPRSPALAASGSCRDPCTDPVRAEAVRRVQAMRRSFPVRRVRGFLRCGGRACLRGRTSASDESQNGLRRLFRLFEETHVPRMVEPRDLRLGMIRDHRFGFVARDVVVRASEDEEHGHLRGAEHVVAVFAFAHSVEQSHDAVVFGQEDLFGEVGDLVLHAGPVFGGEACGGGRMRQRLFAPRTDQCDFAQAVCLFSGVSGFGVELSRTRPSSISG